MKTVIVHGQNHEGSTCHVARMLAGKLGGELTEFFLPRDFGEFCIGCAACFLKSERACPHHEKLQPIMQAMDEADVIILASPVYAYHATGAMKAFLDHCAYRWMVHRPEEKMFSKQAVCISTASGSGTISANKDMADSTFFWGCARTCQLGAGVAAASWDEVSPKVKAQLERKTSAAARRIKGRASSVKPGVKTRAFFSVMRLMQKNGWNPADRDYWRDKGWLGKKRPWHQ